MIKIAVPHGSRPLLSRLKELGKAFSLQKNFEIKALSPDTLQWVYAVDSATLQSSEWPLLRAALAAANRYYIVVSSVQESAQLVQAMRDGAYDVITHGDSPQRWADAITTAAAAQQLWWDLYGAADMSWQQSGLVGRSQLMGNLRDAVQRIGPTLASVLVMGESGTGKERVAEAIHAASGRGAFVSLNCAAIPPELLESELFGADKGAFTGAANRKEGLVEAANGGTLFLDEIGELGLALQPKLLRFLETRRARRVGSTKENLYDVRIISATNRNLPIEVEQGRFRTDLFYRLCEFELRTPPLRARAEDIADLAQVFLAEASERFGRYFSSLEPELIEKFRTYNWPGNVRELRQTIERLTIHYDGPILRASWWTPPTGHAGGFGSGIAGSTANSGATGNIMAGTVANVAGTHTEASSHDDVSRASIFPQAHIQQAAQQAAIPAFTQGNPPAHSAAGYSTPPAANYAPPARLNKRERVELARRLLEQSDGDLTWTAAQLGIHPTTLFRWRKAGKLQ